VVIVAEVMLEVHCAHPASASAPRGRRVADGIDCLLPD